MSAPVSFRAAAAIAGAVALAGAASPAASQSLAGRVAAVADGDVVLTYATRLAVCGDGRDVVALGSFLSAGDSEGSYGHGWTGVRCEHGPARLVLTVQHGTVTAVRLSVGRTAGAALTAPAVRDLGVVRASDAADLALALAARLEGRSARRAIVAVAVADSADVWRELLALARDGGAPEERTRATAMRWLAAVAPPAAVGPVTALVRDERQGRSVREGGVSVLAFAPEGAGVAALVGLARGVPDPWLREKATFWLGQTDDDRARSTLRDLAAGDTVAGDVRAQAIFAIGFGQRDDADARFVRSLYPRLTTERLREKAIQSMAQFEDPASRRWLLDLAASDDETVAARKQALFWAGQQRDAPFADLLAMDSRLHGTELRKHYAFVLSQSEQDAALDRLIELAARDADRQVRHQALFWLGQSRSPRARDYLAQVIAR